MIKRDFLKVYHQQVANPNAFDQNVSFLNGENNNYLQISNAYLEFVVTVRNTAANFDTKNGIRLINIAFAYCFKEAFLSTTGGSDLKHNTCVGQVSFIMRSITSKDGDLLTMEIQML